MYYNWRRYYDPKTGRYISVDPIGLSGGINQYAYVGNNPLMWYDPYGLSDSTDTWEDIGSNVVEQMMFPWSLFSDYLFQVFPEGIRRGTYFGTGYGEEAVDYWACKYNKESGPFYRNPKKLGFAMLGLSASLWTEETWFGTVGALGGAYTWRLMGPYSTRGLPKYIQRIRTYIRYDRPHHHKPGGWDGKWFQ